MVTSRLLRKWENCLVFFFAVLFCFSLSAFFSSFTLAGYGSNWHAGLPTSILVVSALSLNHFKEGLKMCKSLHRHKELREDFKLRLVIYNLGDLTGKHVKELKNACPLSEMRNFTFAEYPDYVANLRQYRWKPIILNETIRESEVLVWADSSTEFQEITNESFKGFIANLTSSEVSMRLVGSTGHSIYRATDPRMYKHLPIPETEAKRLMMFSAALQVWVRTPKLVESVLKPWLQCSLVENCMGPKKAQIRCEMKKFPEPQYAQCHRFDQSAINIILANVSGFKQELYQSESQLLVTKRF